MYTFAVVLSTNFCSLHNNRCTDKREPKTGFLPHGLWPEAENCGSKLTKEEELNTTSFQKYEFEKHGSCICSTITEYINLIKEISELPEIVQIEQDIIRGKLTESNSKVRLIKENGLITEFRVNFDLNTKKVKSW